MKIILVAGARPNFMKIAPIIRRLKVQGSGSKGKELSWQLIHTGQHYDFEMSKVFFDELEIPEPDCFLNAGPGSHAEQTAKIMVEFEKVCLKEKPDVVVVVGDVNSTLACSITAKKMEIEVAHVEAGLRSGDMSMPEEINRIVTDSISDYLFVTEKSGIDNLKSEGRKEQDIFFVGNVMIDTLYYQLEKSSYHPHPALPLKGEGKGGEWKKEIPKQLNYVRHKIEGVRHKGYDNRYAVVTLHRPSNVDNNATLCGIMEAFIRISEDMPVIFPAHPRTRKNIEEFGLLKIINGSNIELLPPLPYMEFLKLWKDATLVLTDSGGLQEETTALGVPCFTIRKNTERPVTIEEGSNTLVGTTSSGILDAFEILKKGEKKKFRVPKYWDGKAAERIVKILIHHKK